MIKISKFLENTLNNTKSWEVEGEWYGLEEDNDVKIERSALFYNYKTYEIYEILLLTYEVEDENGHYNKKRKLIIESDKMDNKQIEGLFGYSDDFDENLWFSGDDTKEITEQELKNFLKRKYIKKYDIEKIWRDKVERLKNLENN